MIPTDWMPQNFCAGNDIMDMSLPPDGLPPDMLDLDPVDTGEDGPGEEDGPWAPGWETRSTSVGGTVSDGRDAFGTWWTSQIPGYEGVSQRPFGFDMAKLIWEASRIADHRIRDAFQLWWLYNGWVRLPAGCDRQDSLRFGEVVWNASKVYHAP